MEKATSAEDRKYRAHAALDTITRAHEHMRDKKLMADVKKLAAEKLGHMEKIVKSTPAKDVRVTFGGEKANPARRMGESQGKGPKAAMAKSQGKRPNALVSAAKGK